MTIIAVLDVNILASAAVSEQGLPRVVLRTGLRRHYRLATSTHILRKLSDTLQKPYFAERLSLTDREEYIRLIVSRSRQYQPDPGIRGIAPDAEDDLVLGTAVKARADFLITGDKGLLAVRSYGEIQIVTAEEFLTHLEGLT